MEIEVETPADSDRRIGVIGAILEGVEVGSDLLLRNMELLRDSTQQPNPPFIEKKRSREIAEKADQKTVRTHEATKDIDAPNIN